MRNSSLVEYLRAENLPGLKYNTEITDKYLKMFVVGERSMGGEAVPKGAVDRMEVRMPV